MKEEKTVDVKAALLQNDPPGMTKRTVRFDVLLFILFDSHSPLKMDFRRHPLIKWATLIVFHFAICLLAFADDELPGEYMRSYDFDAADGVDLILKTDGTFDAKTERNISRRPQIETLVGTTGEFSGTWKHIGSDVLLSPQTSNGELQHNFSVLHVVDWEGRIAFLPKMDEGKGRRPSARFLSLLLKERPNVDDATSAAAKLEWNSIKTEFVERFPGAPRTLVGKLVMFEGERANYGDSKQLIVESEGIHCRIRNEIDGTRSAEFWPAGMVRVRVKGTILSINPATRTVEIQPIDVYPISAR